METNSNRLFGPLLVLLLVLGSVPAYAQQPAGTQTAAATGNRERLAALVTDALANNPDLQAAEARWQMARQRIVPARSLADPSLSFALSNYPVDSLAGDETPMTGQEIQLSQVFPFPGKLAAKGAMAERQALWFKGVYMDARAQLAQRVKDAWYRLYFQQRSIAITGKNLAILQDFIRLTETRYAVGSGLQQDVLKAQVTRSKLQDQLLQMQQQRTTDRADLNRLLNRPAGEPLDLPEALVPTTVDASLSELLALARNRRPLFDAYRAVIDRYKAQSKLARLDSYPDFKVFAGYRLRQDVPGDPVEGSDFVSAGVSINLPLWQDKRKAAVAEADSGVRMAQRQLDDFRSRVEFDISDHFARMEKNRKLVELYRSGIIPQAEQSFEASLAAYRVGDVDFLNLLDSLLALYRYRIDFHRALADHERSVAGLEAAVGLDSGFGRLVGDKE